MDLHISTTKNLPANKNLSQRKPNFGSSSSVNLLMKTLPSWSKPLAWFVTTQEQNSGLSHIRFIQDTATNWVPKATFSRSKEDLAEMSFLEFSESSLFYYAPALLGEHLFRRKIFSKFLPKELQKFISQPVSQLLKNPETIKNNSLKKILPVKAAIALSCICVPAAEYALSYAKNLFTLKVFKKADFNNIANLDKNKKEDPAHQEFVKKSSIKHIKLAGIVSAIGIGLSLAIAAFGHKSKNIQKLSQIVLEPGAKLANKAGIKSPSLKKFLNTHLRFDFDNNNGKLCLSKGQLTATVIAGGFGYFGASKDRGRLDFLETATRLPLVMLYTIFGSSLVEHYFNKYLFRKNLFKDLITQNPDNKTLNIAKLNDLQEIAEKIAKKKGTSLDSEWKKLFKQKSIISLVPFSFSLIIMGFFIAGMSRFWTQYRFNNSQKNKELNSQLSDYKRYESNFNSQIYLNFCKNYK